jgi:hypothetical protein
LLRHVASFPDLEASTAAGSGLVLPDFSVATTAKARRFPVCDPISSGGAADVFQRDSVAAEGHRN